MNLTRIHQIALHAEDLNVARDFYEKKLGAKFIAQYGQHLLFFDFSGIRILLEKNAKPATVYFWVENIDVAYDELVSNGIEFDSKPHMIHKDDDGTFGVEGNEEWMAFFTDPSGNILCIATQKAPC